MALLTIPPTVDVGLVANDGTGDNLRNAFITVNTAITSLTNFITTGPNFTALTVDGQLSASTLTSQTGNFTDTLFATAGTESTSPTTGSLRVTGGTGISGNLHVGGTINGNVLSSLVTTSSLLVQGPTEITGDTITGNLSVGVLGSPADLIVTNNAEIWGELTVHGNVVTITSSEFKVVDPVIEVGKPEGNVTLSNNDGKDRGLSFYWYDTVAGTQKQGFFGFENESQEFTFQPSVTIGNVNTFSGSYGNIRVSNVNANVHSTGDSVFHNITADHITVGNGLVVSNGITGTIVTAAQPNIIQVGALTNLTVAGDVTTTNGNISVPAGKTIYVNGVPVALSSEAFHGGNVPLPTIFISNTASTSTSTGAVTVPSGGIGVSGNINAGGSVTGDTVTATNGYTGTLLTAEQPNITTVGTLGNLTVQNSLSSDTASFNTLTVASSLTTTSITTTTGGFTGTLQTAAQPNITSVGTLTSLTTSGNLTLSGAGKELTLGTGDGAATPRQTITINPNGLAAPSLATGTTSDGDKLVTWNANGYKSGIGNDLNTLWLQSTGQATGGMKFYTGATTTPALALTINPNQTITANSSVTANGLSSTAGVTSTTGFTSATGSVNVGGGITSGATISGVSLSGNITTAAQPNITSLGTLTSLSVTGTLTANGTLATAGAITTTGAGTKDIGTTTNRFAKLYSVNIDNSGLLSSAQIVGSFNGTIGNNTPASGTFTTVTANGLIESTTNGFKFPDGTVQTTAGIASGGSIAYASTAGGITGQANSATITSTPSNVASTIVSRDGSGNFVASTITASLVGNVTGNVSGSASTVTSATQSAITSVGTLTTLNVTGNTTIGGNVTVSGTTNTGRIITTDNIYAGYNTSFAGGRFIKVENGDTGVSGTANFWAKSDTCHAQLMAMSSNYAPTGDTSSSGKAGMYNVTDHGTFVWDSGGLDSKVEIIVSAPTYGIKKTSTFDNTGNLTVQGSVIATNFGGSLTGNVTGNVTGNLTGNLTGNVTGNSSSATNATNADNVGITNNIGSVSTYYPTMSVGTSGNNALTVSNTKLSFVPSTGTLTATKFAGDGSLLTNIPYSALTGSPSSPAGNVTIGTTTINLGGTSTTLAGLTSVTSTTLDVTGNTTVGGNVTVSGTTNTGRIITTDNIYAGYNTSFAGGRFIKVENGDTGVSGTANFWAKSDTCHAQIMAMSSNYAPTGDTSSSGKAGMYNVTDHGTFVWDSGGLDSKVEIIVSAPTYGIKKTSTFDNTGNLTVQGSVIADTFIGVASQSGYGDLAENYRSDDEYPPGTVVVFGGPEEVTVTNKFANKSVAGVVSTAPAYLMNKDEHNSAPVALRGKVPVKLIGPVEKGDLLVTSATSGYAQSVGIDDTYGHAIFAKALQTDTSEGTKVIYAVII